MNRWSITSIAFMCLGAFAVAQQQPDSEQSLSSDLVQWSYMQQPQQPEQGAPRQTPTPDPSPETQPSQNPAPSHPARPEQPDNAPASGSQAQSPTAQTFTGIIHKEADSFMLKVSESTSYKLDNQQEVQQYEGKRVRVTGTLESSINLIHVDKIEPLS